MAALTAAKCRMASSFSTLAIIRVECQIHAVIVNPSLGGEADAEDRPLDVMHAQVGDDVFPCASLACDTRPLPCHAIPTSYQLPVASYHRLEGTTNSF